MVAVYVCMYVIALFAAIAGALLGPHPSSYIAWSLYLSLAWTYIAVMQRRHRRH